MKTALSSRFVRTTAALALGLSATFSTAQAQEELKFYNWSDYIAEDTIARFEQETGIKVTYDVYDSNETLEAKLMAGNSGYDLVVPSSNFMELQIKAGIFQQLDKDKLSNLKNLDPALLTFLDSKDPGNKHGVPYLWGTTGIGYNMEMVTKVLGADAPVDSWELILNPAHMEKLAECGVTFLDSPNEMYPIALQYAGMDPDSASAKDYKSSSPAAKLLKDVRPYVRQFNSSQYINDIANGDICVAVGWSGDVFQAQARAEEVGNGIEVSYAIPKEGTEIWFDMLMIPADAENSENAHKFINYLLRPDVIAEITNYVAYANPNLAATNLVEPDIATDPGIYPPAETRKRLFVTHQRPGKIAKLQNRFWSNLKTGR